MIWDWLVYQVPWYVYAGLGVVAVGVVYRLYGWQGSLALLTGLIAVFGYQKGMQQGYNDRQAKGQKETSDAIEKANAARDDSDRFNADDKRLHSSDGFKRNK